MEKAVNERGATIITVVLVIAIIVLIICIIVWIWGAVEWGRFKGAANKALDNDIYCKGNDCELKIDDTLTTPASIPSDFDYGLARYCTDLIARVYSDDSLTMPTGMSRLSTIKYRDRTIGFIGKTDVAHWVVIGASVADEKWRKYYEYDGHNVHHSKQRGVQTSTKFEPSGLLCYKGFNDIYECIRDSISKELAAVNATNVVITGHSLGATTATLACIDLADTYTVTGYTFGSPRVCNNVPVDSMNGFHRIENTTDTVSDTPFAVTLNLHNHESPFFYTHGGTNLTFTQNRKSVYQNNSLQACIEAIENQTLQIGGQPPVSVSPTPEMSCDDDSYENNYGWE